MAFQLQLRVVREGCGLCVKEVGVVWLLMLVWVVRLLLVWSSVSSWTRFGFGFGPGLVCGMMVEVEEVLFSAAPLLSVV